MNRTRLFLLILALSTATLLPAQSSSMESLHWTLSQRNFKLTQADEYTQNGEFVDFMGRHALKLSKGLIYSPELNFSNGTIEFDMACASNGRFFGIAFHIESDDNYEVIFFRPGSSGTDQAIQYTGVFLGAPAWQIYTGPGYIAQAQIPREQWIHVRLVLTGLVAKLYLNNAADPALTIPDLKRGAVGGSIGFWGHMGDAYFTNLTWTADNASYPTTVERKFLPGVITGWEVSDLFDNDKVDRSAHPDARSLKWEKVAPENPGMVLINRYRRSPNILPPDDRAQQESGRAPGSQFVFAKTTIHSDGAEVRKMYLGYSDEVVVFLNGRPLYAGNNALTFREPRTLGLMTYDSDAVYLPLKKGDNELMLSVTEYFGGWAFLCRFAE